MHNVHNYELAKLIHHYFKRQITNVRFFFTKWNYPKCVVSSIRSFQTLNSKLLAGGKSGKNQPLQTETLDKNLLHDLRNKVLMSHKMQIIWKFAF